MGKGSGGSWWAFLVLVGVLLAAAAMPTAVGQWNDCDARCGVDHQSDPWNVPMCIYHCHFGVHAAANEDRSQCQKQCDDDKVSKQQCVEACERRQQEGGGGGGGDTGDAGDAGDVERHRHDRGRCEHICRQHYIGDYHRLLECIRRCQGRQEEASVVREGADDAGTDRARCEKACRQHFIDIHRLLECIKRCQGRQEAASVVVHGGADDDKNKEGGDRCEKQCQHYGDYGKRQQCVYHCRGGSGGFKTVVGAILEVV